MCCATGKWLFDWVLLQCGRDDCRLIVDGLKRADGNGEVQRQRGNRIVTSSRVLRDQLLVLLLHAGYAAHWSHGHRAGVEKGFTRLDASDDAVYREDEIDDVSQFRGIKTAQQQEFVVSWCGREAEDQMCVTPTLRKADVQPEPYTGPLWCVQVAHADHLIVAQRAVVDEQGAAVRASLPVIVGNCWAFETGIAMDAKMADELPYNNYYEYYGPDFNLHIQPSNMENQNTPKYLERTQSMLLDVLKQLPAAPSVQYSTAIPREREDVEGLREEKEEEEKEAAGMDVSGGGQLERDRRREPDNELFTEEKDSEREVRGSSSSGSGSGVITPMHL